MIHTCDYQGRIGNKTCDCGLQAPSNRGIIVSLDDVVLEYYVPNGKKLRLVKAPSEHMFVKTELGHKWVHVSPSNEEEVEECPHLACYWIDGKLYMEV